MTRYTRTSAPCCSFATARSSARRASASDLNRLLEEHESALVALTSAEAPHDEIHTHQRALLLVRDGEVLRTARFVFRIWQASELQIQLGEIESHREREVAVNVTRGQPAQRLAVCHQHVRALALRGFDETAGEQRAHDAAPIRCRLEHLERDLRVLGGRTVVPAAQRGLRQTERERTLHRAIRAGVLESAAEPRLGADPLRLREQDVAQSLARTGGVLVIALRSEE